jgi:hypothetical protein
VVALITTGAVAWLSAVVIADIRRAPDVNCIEVDASLMEVITSRPASGALEPLTAEAVQDPWTRSKGSVPFENYYAIALQFRRADGSTSQGVWGLGSDAQPSEGTALSVAAAVAPLVSVDEEARASTVWPENEMYFPEGANAVK